MTIMSAYSFLVIILIRNDRVEDIVTLTCYGTLHCSTLNEKEKKKKKGAL